MTSNSSRIQWLAIVGDPKEEIKSQLIKQLPQTESKNFVIKNNYYTAEFCLNTFPDAISFSHDAKKYPDLCAIFARYRGMDELSELACKTEMLDIDLKIVIVESTELCSEYEDIESWASVNLFEVVYLIPDEEQLNVARSICEKVGIERLVEALHVCNWPQRNNAFTSAVGNPNIDNILKLINEMDRGDDENEFGNFTLAGESADAVYEAYLNVVNVRIECTSSRSIPSETPEPQHAERVHLSPDSPTDTETTNIEDNSVSAEFDLVCHRPHQEQVDRNHENSMQGVSAAISKSKKKKKNKGKNSNNNPV